MKKLLAHITLILKTRRYLNMFRFRYPTLMYKEISKEKIKPFVVKGCDIGRIAGFFSTNIVKWQKNISK